MANPTQYPALFCDRQFVIPTVQRRHAKERLQASMVLEAASSFACELVSSEVGQRKK